MHEINEFVDGLPQADAQWVREQPWAEAAAGRCWADDAGALWRILAPALLEQRAELADRERVTGELLESWSYEATPLHHQLARISMAAWDPHVDGNVFRELVRAVVGHPSGLDGVAHLATLRAECRRVGIPVADTAEEKVARVRGWLGEWGPRLPGGACHSLDAALDGPAGDELTEETTE